jgi:hypothetical protein
MSSRRRCALSSRAQEGRIREARRALEAVRAEATQLEIARATAESDLSHLASSCVETVQATLDEVAAEVAQLERDGLLASPRPVDDAPEAAEIEDDATVAATGEFAGTAGSGDDLVVAAAAGARPRLYAP